MTTVDESCTVYTDLDDGTYVKIGPQVGLTPQYRVHVYAFAFGGCELMALDCSQSPCVCIHYDTQYRRPVGVHVSVVGPLGNYNVGTITPTDNSAQEWNSAVSGETVPAGLTWRPYHFLGLGEHVFRFKETIYKTNCNIEPGEWWRERAVHVLQCEPRFLGNGSVIPHLEPIGPDTIKVFLPAGMSGASSALDAAVNSWNSVLAETDVDLEFEVVTVSCGEIDPDTKLEIFGPGCIRVIQDPELEACGEARANPYDSETGFHKGNLRIVLNANWSTYSTESLARTLAHELGHLLGLDNYSTSCSVDHAVMQDTFSCSPTAEPSTAVTVNDYLAVQKTVYDGGTQASCGFD